MPQLNPLMMYAEAAVAYVDSCRIRASNRFENGQGQAGMGDEVQNVRTVLGNFNLPLDSIASVRKRAELCAQLRYGNCNEQAALAMVYLMDRYGPAAGGMALVMTATYNHVFLVIGLPRIGRGDMAAVIPGTLAVPPVDWEQAVICDPWYHEWYEMKDFEAKMRQTLIQSSQARRIASNTSLELRYQALA